MATANSPFGTRSRNLEVVNIFLPAAADVVDSWAWVHPGDGLVYTLIGVKEVHDTASSSGTLAVRRVTAEATAPDATAGATVIEMLANDTLDLASTANTTVNAELITTLSDRAFVSGDKVGLDAGGTMTNYAVGLLQLVFNVGGY